MPFESLSDTTRQFVNDAFVNYCLAEKILSATLINVNEEFAQAVQSSNFSLRFGVRRPVCSRNRFNQRFAGSGLSLSL